MRQVFFLLITLSLVVSHSSAEDWPQWRGQNRDGKAVEAGLQLDWNNSKPQHQWTIDGMGSGYASVSVVDGKLYTTGNLADSQAVICVDLVTQKRLWATPVTEKAPKHGYAGSRCTPTINGDRAYVVTSDGNVACLNRANGKVVWNIDMRDKWGGRMMSGWGFSESPLVDGDWIVCTPGGNDAIMVALNKSDGSLVWKTPVKDLGEVGKDGAGYSSIVISEGAGEKQYVQMVGRGLIGVRASDGKLLWNYNKVANKTANIPTPICIGDHVFASTGYQTGACLVKLSKSGDGIKATEEYFLNPKTFQNHHGGMIQIGEYVYAGHKHGNGFPICVHWPTGKIQWGGDIRPAGSGSAALTCVNDQILFRYQDGTIAIVKATPDAYELQGTFMPEFQEGKTWSHPVVVDGKLYLREQDKLMCYQL